MHPLLKKQIEKYFGSETNIPAEMQDLFAALDLVFEQEINAESNPAMIEEQLRKIFNGTSDAIILFNPINDRILDANPRAVEILGYSHAELLALPASTLHPNDPKALKAFNEDVLKNGYGWTSQLISVTKNGTDIKTEISASLTNFDKSQKAILSIMKDTSNRHETEEELHAQRAFLRQVIDTNPSLVYAKNRAGEYTLANEAMADAMATTVEKILGKTERSVNPDSEQVERYEHQDQEIFENGKEFIEPQEHSISQEGNDQYRQIIKRPLYDHEGNITQILGVINDITPLKLAERSLQQQNQTLKVISEISREISLTTSLDSILDKANHAITETLDISSNYICSWDSQSSIATVVSESISEYAAPSEKNTSRGETYNLAKFFAEINEWLQTSKEPKSIQVATLQDPKLKKYYESNAIKTALYIPILLEEQTFGYIEIYESRNSREFTQTELDFLQAIAYQLGIAFNNERLFSALQSSERRFRSLIENSSDVITIVNADAVIEYASPTTKKILGYEPEELLGSNYFQNIHKNDVRRVYDTANNALENPTTVREFRYKFRHKNGEWVHFESTINVRPIEGGGHQLFINSRDVSSQIENVEHQQEQFERRGRQAEFTNQVTRKISLAKTRTALYDVVANALHANLDIHYHHVQFFRYNPALNQLVLVTAAGPKAANLLRQGYQIDLNQGLSGRAAATLSSILIQDTEKSSSWQPTPFVDNTCSAMATPVMLGDELLGVINIQSTEISDFDTDIQVLLEVLSGQIAISIDSIRLRSEMEERIEELSVLQRYTASEGWDSFHKSTPLASTGYTFDPLEESYTALTNGSVSIDKEEDNSLIKPMIVQGQEIGAIGIETDSNQPLSAEEQSLLDEITAEVSEALDRARLFEASQRSAAELAVLNEMGNAFTEALNEQAIIDNIFIYAAKLMEIDSFYVALYDDESQLVSFPLVYIEDTILQPDHPSASEWQPREAGAGLTGHIIANRQPILIEDNAEEIMENLDLPFVQIGQMTQSWVGVPMTIGDRVLGVINAQSDEVAGLYNDHHLGLLVSIAGQASIAIENARLFEQEQSRAEQERLVRTITDRIRRGADRESILKIALEEISNAMGAKKSMIKLGTPDQLISPTQSPATDKSANGQTEEV